MGVPIQTPTTLTMKKFFIFAMMVIPWIVIPVTGIADQYRLPKDVFFDFICIGMLCFAIKDGLRFEYKNKYLAILLCWLGITFFVWWYYPYTFAFEGIERYGVFTVHSLIHIILAISASLVAMCTFTKEDYQNISDCLCISATLVSFYGILQFIGLEPMGKMIGYQGLGLSKCTALLGHQTIVASYIALSLPYFYNRIRQPKYVLMMIICIIALFMCQSSMSIIAIIASLVCFSMLYYIRKKKVIIASFISFISIISSLILLKFIGISGIVKALNGRDYIWSQAISHIKDNPLFGQGIGCIRSLNIHLPVNFMQSVDNWIVRNGDLVAQVHNDYIELALSIGIIGLILFCLLVVNSIRNSSINTKKFLCLENSYVCSFITFLVLMVGMFPMEISPLALSGLIAFWGIERL